MKNKRLTGIVLIVVFLLLIPLVAMQFIGEVDWSPFDFLIMGLLLLITSVASEFLLRKVKRLEHRLAICGAPIVAFLLIWLELAVGIFGSPFAGT